MSVFHFRAGRKWIVAAFAATLAATLACARGADVRVREHLVDDFGDSVVVGARPSRIVSLSPATTEILFALGAGPRLVGRTHWDSHPDSALLVPDLGNGIRPNVEALIATRPDLVVIYATDDNRDAARALRRAGARVIAIRMDHIADFVRATTLLGAVTGEEARAKITVDSVTSTLDRVRATTSTLPHPTVFMPFYEQPLLAIGGGSFISELIDIAGARNVFADLSAPSPQVSLEEVLHRDPDVIIAGPHTLETLRGDPRWQPLSAMKSGRLLVLDTSLVQLPGVRLGQAAVALARLLHPGVIH